MKKYTISLLILSCFLYSCSKDVSIDGLNVNSSSGINVSTQDWSMTVWVNGTNMISWENETSIWSDWINVWNKESEVKINSAWMGIQSEEWTMKMDENGMTSNIEWVWDVSITNTGSNIWGVNISSWNVAEDLIKNSMSNELKGMNIDSMMDTQWTQDWDSGTDENISDMEMNGNSMSSN